MSSCSEILKTLTAITAPLSDKPASLLPVEAKTMRSWYWPGFFRILQFLHTSSPEATYKP